MPHKIGKALAYAVLIWLVGFVWGSVVFMTPALKNIPSLPYISRYPAISFPLLIICPFFAYFLARRHLKSTTDQANAGLKMGIIFSGVNLVLDFLLLVLLFGTGLVFFSSLTVWFGYVLLLIVPWLTGRFLQRSTAT